MPLSAVVGGRMVIGPLLDDAQWSRLKGAQVTLAPCGHKGFPRVSRLGTRHFVHERDCGTHRPESAEHLHVKAVVAGIAATCGWQVATEAPGPGFVADVLARRGGSQIAFEVQWSRQVLQEYRRRQETYREAGVRAVWLVRSIPTGHRAGPDLPLFLLEDWMEQTARCVVSGRRAPLGTVVRGLLGGRCRWRDTVPGGGCTVELLELLCPVCGTRRVVEEAVWASGRCTCGLPVLSPRVPGFVEPTRCCGYWGPSLILGRRSRQRSSADDVQAGHWCLSAESGPR